MQWPIVIQGREVDEEEVQWLSSWVAEHAHWSRRKLAGELCVRWDWRDGSGRPKDLAARSFLLKIEQRGWIALPPLRENYRKPRAIIGLPSSVPQEESLEGSFEEVGPTSLEVVGAGTEAYRRWAYYLSRHHYLGLRVVGQNIGYLASHILGSAARRIDRDWQEKYGQGLEWLETFVERGRFAGTCYRAANWVHVGITRGRGRQDRKHTASVPEKDVYLLRIKA